VSSGLFQYPFIICGPFTAISPTSSTSASSNVSIWIILASVSGHGTPILPFTLFFHTKLACVTGDDSVNPYPSTNRPPVFCSNCSCISDGNGADPLIQAFIDDKSYLLMSGCFNSPIYIVGSPGNNVGLCLWIVFSTYGDSNFGCIILIDMSITILISYT